MAEKGLTESTACPHRRGPSACYLGENHSDSQASSVRFPHRERHVCCLFFFFFLHFVSNWFEVGGRESRIPSGTDCCRDEMSIYAARFSIELTRQLISISVCLTSSRISLAVISPEASWVLCVTERVCVCMSTHACVISVRRAQCSEPYSCNRSECKAIMGLR